MKLILAFAVRRLLPTRNMKAVEAVPRLKLLLEQGFNPELRGILTARLKPWKAKTTPQHSPLTPGGYDHRAELNSKILQTGNDEERIAQSRNFPGWMTRTIVEHLVARVSCTPVLAPGVQAGRRRSPACPGQCACFGCAAGALRKSG